MRQPIKTYIIDAESLFQRNFWLAWPERNRYKYFYEVLESEVYLLRDLFVKIDIQEEVMSEMEIDGSIGLRIKGIRQASGLTQKEFADSLGIVQGFLSGVERGKKNISDTLIIALCHSYGINRQWLESGLGEKFRELQLKASHPSSIPLFTKIPQDFPNFFIKEDICDYLSLPESTEGSYAILSGGDFMAPTICDGDLVIISVESLIENRDIVLVNNRWGEAILRRYRVVGSDIFLAPDNRAYAPFKKDSKLKILGKVVDVWRRIKF